MYFNVFPLIIRQKYPYNQRKHSKLHIFPLIIRVNALISNFQNNCQWETQESSVAAQKIPNLIKHCSLTTKRRFVHPRFLPFMVMRGTIISSIEMPPCWKVSR